MVKVFTTIKAAVWRQRVAVWGFFGLFLVLGLFILRDYGISTDEPQQRRIGLVSVKYVAEMFFPSFVEKHAEFKEIQNIKEFGDHDYGVAFEMPVAWLEQVLGIEDWRNVVFFRHLCTFLVTFWGGVAVYQLALRRFKDWRLGLLAAVMLVLTPRIFAEMFYNNKDVVFLTVFAIATNTCVAFIEQPSWRRLGWHALASACAIDVRIMGVLLPVATLAIMSLQALRGAYKRQRIFLKLPVYLGLMMALVVLFWPYLWEAPFQNFVAAFRGMSQFRWGGSNLYAGESIKGTELPWHYISGWIGVTTPVLYLVGFVVGAFLIVRQLVRRRFRLYATDEEWQDLLFLGLTLAPLAAVVALNSVLYNAWRQLYFVYPSLLLVALRGFVAIRHWNPIWPSWQSVWPRLCHVALGGTLLVTAGQMVAMHPFQNTYFNALTGPNVQENYEIDYWVLSYRAGLEWIARHDDRSHIVISAQRTPELQATWQMLLPEDRSRMQVVEDPAASDYYLTTYYNHPGTYSEYPAAVANIRAGGQLLLSVFRPKW